MRLGGDDGLSQKLLIEVFRCDPGLSLGGNVLDLSPKGGIFGELTRLRQRKPPWETLDYVILLLVGENELISCSALIQL